MAQFLFFSRFLSVARSPLLDCLIFRLGRSEVGLQVRISKPVKDLNNVLCTRYVHRNEANSVLSHISPLLHIV